MPALSSLFYYEQKGIKKLKCAVVREVRGKGRKRANFDKEGLVQLHALK